MVFTGTVLQTLYCRHCTALTVHCTPYGAGQVPLKSGLECAELVWRETRPQTLNIVLLSSSL